MSAAVAGACLFREPARWRALQAEGLRRHLRQAARSGMYRDIAGRWPDAEGITGETLGRVLRQLPLTTKDQLIAAGPAAYAASMEEVSEWVSTSGTTGRPLDVPLTAGDLERLAGNEEVALGIAGIGKGDLVVLGVAMDRMFVAGLAYWSGAGRIGAARVRVGPQLAAQPGMLRELMRRIDAASGRVFVIAVPTFLMHLEPVKVGRKLAGIVAIGEPIRQPGGAYNGLGRRLQERFECPVMSTYASTETCTTFAEGPGCGASGGGGHLNPEMGIVEILDERGEPVKAGEVGEVVVTPLGVEGMPLVRFRTGDMAALIEGRCACGRTTPRVGPIMGRRQQLLKFRGTSVYPAAIAEALRSLDVVADCAVVAEEEEALSDRISVYVALRGGGPVEAEARRAVEGQLRAVLRVMPDVRYLEEAELQALQQRAGGGRKLMRFIDRRRGAEGAKGAAGA